MNELIQYQELLTKLQEEIESYSTRPTKACSARIRKLSNQLGKDGVHLRKALINADREN